MAVNRKKTTVRRASFSATRALALYRQGKNVSQIAQAMGYEKGTGNNRVRNAIMKAGEYKGRAAAAAVPARKPARTAHPKPNLDLGVPNDPDTALKVCLRFINMTTANLKLDSTAERRFSCTLLGAIATHFGVHDFQVRKPVLVIDKERAGNLMEMAQA